MKELRDYQLKVRLTQTERELFQDYAARANITMSELVRMALYRLVEEK